MKNIHITKRLMALLSAATIALTSSGCGEKENKENNNISSTTTLISSSISKEELVSSTIAKPEIIDSSIASITSEVSTSSNNSVSSTSSKNSTTTSNVTSNITTSSNNPVSSSSQVSTSSKEEETSSFDIYSVNEVTKENINDPEAFRYLARKFSADNTIALKMMYEYPYNGEIYRTNGEQEFKLLMAILNYEYINDSTFQAVFSNCTLEELNRCASFVKDLIQAQQHTGQLYSFNKYIIDDDLANTVHKFNDSIVYERGNLGELINGFFIEKNFKYNCINVNDGVNYLLLYPSYRYGKSTLNDETKIAIYDMKDDIENEYYNFVANIYNKSRDKSLQLTK